ncbi:SCO4225 family membrane protein [Streptomyces sp. NPDC017991]|uniref:SCO4225 family membrane protein n=1 Tax=Streptomyces sp. NPDC017991 TaxID=3365026 RepID=UPI003798B202
MQNASPPRSLPPLRRVLALATNNWPARSYLAAVGLSVAAMIFFPDSGVAELAMLLTAPLSYLAIVLPFGPGTTGGGAIEVLAIGFWSTWLVLCALVNASVLGALLTTTAATHGPRDPSSPAARPSRETAGVARPTSPHRHTPRSLLAPAVDNWIARGYLVIVAASLAFFLGAAYLLPDPGFAGIWPLIATAPLSIIAFVVAIPTEWASSLPWLNPLVFSAGAALSGLFNATLLGRLVHRLRADKAQPAAW